MKVLVTGASGMLAQAVGEAFRGVGWEVLAATRDDLDVTDPRSVDSFLEAERPNAVFQGAAYTSVDGAEKFESTARSINVTGAHNVASACQRFGSLFVYPSTDYVFSAATNEPRRPGDPTRPINAYGRSKLDGEVAAAKADRSLVVRTSWLFGQHGTNFVDTILDLCRKRPCIEVVDDQIGRPTWTRALAKTIVALVEGDATGTFHATGGGPEVSWYGFANEIVARAGESVEVRAVSSDHAARAARRPGYSVLDCSLTEERVGIPMADWRESLTRYLEDRAHDENC